MANNSKKPKLILEKVLRDKRISKADFAKKMDWETSNLSRYFKKGANPRLDTLIRWAEVLDCKVSDLIEE